MHNSQRTTQFHTAIEHTPWILGQLATLLGERQATRPQLRTGEEGDAFHARSFQPGIVREIDGLGAAGLLSAGAADGTCTHRIVCGRPLLPVCDDEPAPGRPTSRNVAVLGLAATVPMTMSMTIRNGRAMVRLWRQDRVLSTFRVADRELTRAMASLYDALWSTVDGSRGHDCGAVVGVPSHLAGVLAQMASGATDRTAQRELGLSLRTYSRRAADLLEVLGVESRFQAGIEAARRGWV
jgi:hypothetical protein